MKNSFLAFGIALVVLGCLILSTPKLRRPFTAVYIDFTGYNVFYGSLLIVVGIVFVWISLRNKGKNHLPSLLICPKCETTLKREEATARNCPKCMTEMESLAGFYDRRPELKGDRGDKNGIS